MHNILKILTLTAVCFCSVTMAFASPQLTLSSPAGNGVFELQGSGFDGVAGLKVTIVYDPATLASPQVTQGGLITGALMAANTNTPGSIILASITPDARGFSGSGSIATITFSRPGSSLGVIQSVSADVYNVKGGKVDARASFSNPTGGVADTGSGGGTGTGSGSDMGSERGHESRADSGSGSGSGSDIGSGSGSGPVVLGGSLVMPTGEETSKPSVVKSKEDAAVEVAAQQKEGPAPIVPGGGEVTRPSLETTADSSAEKGTLAKRGNSVVPAPSVLEQFRLFQEQKTPQALVAIVDRNARQQNAMQEPPAALSNGSTRVKFIIKLPSSGKNSPSFAFENAKLESLKMEGESIWIADVLPTKGGSDASVRMFQDGAITIFSLTVAPPIPPETKIGKEGALTETDFKLFLKDSGKDKSPRYDLNGDGKHDYVDDYIFTVNYIVSSEQGKKVKAKEPK